MKSIGMTLLALVLLAGTAAAAGDEAAKQGKNRCLLYGEDCGTARQDTLQEKIDKLRDEIENRGHLYTREELQRLEWKREEAEKMLFFLLHPGNGWH